MPEIIRYDRGSVKAIETGEGFLRATVVMAAPGVYPYMDAAGSVKLEAKLPEELSNPETVISADGKPATDGHPPKSDNYGLVVSDNYQKYFRGTVSSPKFENGELIACVTIYDAALIQEVLSKEKVQVSLGQVIQLDNKPGTLNGYRYDAAQRKVRINHLAFVKAGRLGEKAKILLDEKDIPEGAAVRVDNDDLLNNAKVNHNQKQQENNMGDIVLKQDSEEYTLWQKIKGLLGKKPDELRSDAADKGKITCPECGHKFMPEGRTDSADTKVLQARIDSLTATVETLTGTNAALKKELEKVKTDAADAKGRDVIIETAKGIIKDIKTDGLSNRDIMLKVISEKMPFKAEVKVDSLSDEVVQARFDAAAEIARIQAAENPDQKKESGGTTVHDAEQIVATKRAERLGLKTPGGN